MSGNLILNVEILGEFKKLTQATKGAETNLSSLNKKASNISKTMTAAFAAIGLGFSLRAVTREMEDAAKAAIEDVKSQELLANALRNTMKATDDQIASVEEVIRKYQFSAAVADDEIRPAYQKLALATKDTTKANELLGVALDVAAGTGKSLEQVSQAMARSLGGSDTALLKLIPSLKGSKQPMEDLAAAFAGASEKAAATDPYQRMKIIFEDLQETVGMALLPTLEKFSTWVASPEGQQKLQQFIDLVTGLAGKFEVLAGWAIDNGDAIIAWSGVIVGAGIALKAFSAVVTVYNGIATLMAARSAAAAAATTAVGVAASGAVPGVVALNTSAGILLGTLTALGAAAIGAGIGGFQQGQVAGKTAEIYSGGAKQTTDPFAGLGKIGTNGKYTPAPTQVNINVNNPNATASDIIKKLDDYYKATGTRLSIQ